MGVSCAAVAYSIGAIATALPPAFLVPACVPGQNGDAVIVLFSSLATTIALYSMLFASTQPRAVLSIAALALAVGGAVAMAEVPGSK